MNEKTKRWVRAAGVRAVKTVAQTAVATIGTAAVLGLLTSVAGLPEVDANGDG